MRLFLFPKIKSALKGTYFEIVETVKRQNSEAIKQPVRKWPTALFQTKENSPNRVLFYF